MPVPLIVDLSHYNGHIDFANLKASGIVGVILKATEGTGYVDPLWGDNHQRAQAVFGHNRVHAYHFLTDEYPVRQMEHFRGAIGDMFGWLDYEPNPNGKTCSLTTAISACHYLWGKTGVAPGMYGSDSDLIGTALGAGHFTSCPLWIARYGRIRPAHAWNLWQYDEHGTVGNQGDGQMDLNAFSGSAEECGKWLDSLRPKFS